MNAVKKSPQRRCVGCREMKDKAMLVRVANNADGDLSLDLGGKAPGRGAYLCRDEGCFALAQKSKGLERSLKRAIAAEIYEQLKNATEAER